MKIITHANGSYDLRAYLAYLDDMSDKLPDNTRAFAFAPGHYDMSHRRCPHDSWVDSLSITELCEGDRNHIRRLEIKARFMGAYHDGFFELTYTDVTKYLLSVGSTIRKDARIGHGDWVVDEILMKGNLVCHEIQFSNSGRWKIVCSDITYLWSSKQ